MLFISWAILGALIGVAAAQKRGFSMVGGVLGGLMLGPLAFLMFFASGVSSADKNRKCPHCAEFVKAEAVICKHCGRELPPYHAPPAKARASVIVPGVIGGVVVLAAAMWFMWANSSYSVDFDAAYEAVQSLETDGLLSNRTCAPNRAEMPFATWRALSDPLQENVMNALSRICIEAGRGADMTLVDPTTRTPYAGFNGSAVRHFRR